VEHGIDNDESFDGRSPSPRLKFARCLGVLRCERLARSIRGVFATLLQLHVVFKACTLPIGCRPTL